MRYEVFAHPEKSGWYLVSDTKWMMELEFQVHKFNETQKVMTMGQLAGRSVMDIARAMREMGEYMAAYHQDIAF